MTNAWGLLRSPKKPPRAEKQFDQFGQKSTKLLTGDDWPSLSYSTASGRNIKSTLHNVDTIWEVREFARGSILCQYGIQRRRIIGCAITFHPVRVDEKHITNMKDVPGAYAQPRTALTLTI